MLQSKLLPGLVELVRQNLSHGQTDLRLFEVGEVFQPSGANEVLPTEQTHVAAVLCGHRDHFLKPTPGDALDFTMQRPGRATCRRLGLSPVAA